jgi:ribosomal protein L18
MKVSRRNRIKAYIRRKVSGTAQKPRLTVFRSNTQIYAQLIDDVHGKTLASASSLGMKEKMTKTEQAAKVGAMVAKIEKSQKPTPYIPTTYQPKIITTPSIILHTKHLKQPKSKS